MQIRETAPPGTKPVARCVAMSVDALIRRNWRYTALLDDRRRAVRRWLERRSPSGDHQMIVPKTVTSEEGVFHSELSSRRKQQLGSPLRSSEEAISLRAVRVL